MTKLTKNTAVLRNTTLAAAVVTALFATSAQAAEFKVGATTIDIGGYLKLDSMITKYNDGTPPVAAIDDFYIPALIPTAAPGAGGKGEDAKFNIHAKTSRFRIKSSTPLENGKKLGGLVEMDFGPGSAPSNGKVLTNRSGVDLRHAVLTYDKWTFGQTWSNMLNGSSIAETLDFFALSEGMIDTRQAQIRYTTGPFSISLENAESRLNTPTGRIDTNDSGLPDLTAKYTHKGGFGNVSIAGIARQLKFEDAASGVDSTKTAGGISIAGRIKAGGMDDIRFAVTTGKGLGRYVGLALNSDGYIDAGGKIQTIDQTAANIGYRHFWTPKTRSTLGYAVYDADSVEAAAGVINDKSQSIHVNLLHSPTKSLTFGTEYIYGKLEKSNGNEGDMSRVQFSAKYSF